MAAFPENRAAASSRCKILPIRICCQRAAALPTATLALLNPEFAVGAEQREPSDHCAAAAENLSVTVSTRPKAAGAAAPHFQPWPTCGAREAMRVLPRWVARLVST
jgi:hypothetical protein